jgi:lipopolysaccharide export system protein LptA
MTRIAFIVLIAVFFLNSHAYAQIPIQFKSSDSDTLHTVYIWHADKLREETKDSLKMQSLVGNVKMQEEKTFFYCDSVVMNHKLNIIEAFGNVHINDSDTTNIFSQYMKYFVDKKYVVFQKKVTMTDGNGTLFTDDMQYDMKQKIGTYQNGGKVINESSVLTSKEGTYYADTKDVYFKKDVVLKDPAYDLKTDSLLYNTKSQLATFITQTYIKDSSGSTIKTKEGNYDLKHHKAIFHKRPVIQQGSQQITGDNVNFDDSSGKSIATGHAVFKDSAQGISVLANTILADKKTKTFLATENPLMILKQEDDSIYITADTLFSGKLSDLLEADSIARYNDSVKTEQQRIKDSIHADSVKMVQAKWADSLKMVNALIARENQRKKDSLELAHIDIPDSVFLRGAIADEKNLSATQDNKASSKNRSKKPSVKPPPAEKESSKNNVTINKSDLNDSSKLVSPKLTDSLHGKAAKVNDSLAKNVVVNKDSLKGDLPINHSAAQQNNQIIRSDSAAQKPDLLRNDTSMKVYTIDVNATNDSANRYLQAYHHVRIFSDSLQAVSDSLFYSAKDSVFRLFTNPIVWANTNQITGDTIYLFTKNKKASRLYVFENGLAINKVGNNLYNQIKGTTLNGYFKDGVIDYMRAKGNAESIYYAQDDNKAFFGVNQSKADVIDMIFLSKELNKVILRNDAEGTMYPIKKVNFDEMRLRNFKWLEEKRPKSKYELFGQ